MWHTRDVTIRARSSPTSPASWYARPTATRSPAICPCSARELIAPVFAESRYRSMVGAREEAERSLHQARLAAARRDWEQVRELSSRADALQQDLKTTQDLSALAQSVYDAPAVAPDAFSPGVTAP